MAASVLRYRGARGVERQHTMPLAIGAAILRYRLYDIVRILSRTLAWALLTVVLGLAYAGVVLGLGRLLPDSSSLVVAAATLAVAAVFQPVRRRVQAVVDQTMQPDRTTLWLRPSHTAANPKAG